MQIHGKTGKAEHENDNDVRSILRGLLVPVHNAKLTGN